MISGEVKKKRLWCFDDAEWIKRITSSKMCLVGLLLSRHLIVFILVVTVGMLVLERNIREVFENSSKMPWSRFNIPFVNFWPTFGFVLFSVTWFLHAGNQIKAAMASSMEAHFSFPDPSVVSVFSFFSMAAFLAATLHADSSAGA